MIGFLFSFLDEECAYAVQVAEDDIEAGGDCFGVECFFEWGKRLSLIHI